MAKDFQNTSSGDSRTFDKALNEDVNDFHLPANSWTQARNAINNSSTGDLGKLGNEPSNLYCISAPYPIIGFIHIIEDRWAVYSTDGVDSEIGLFIENNCGLDQEIYKAYQTIVNAPCLNFSQENLIIGVSRSTSTCTYNLYWDDGVNPSRVLEIDADNPDRNLYTNPESTIPWIETCVDNNGLEAGGCIFCTNTSVLDCDKIRLAQFISPICPRVEKGYSGGTLLNGSYFVAMAYSIKGQKISDWYISNIQGLFNHNNSSSSLDVYIDSIDLDFDEIIVAIVSNVNQQAVARQAGLYSTRQTNFSFDIINNTWPSIPLEQLPIMTPIVNKSDAMYTVGDYLLRSGTTSKEDFNYQPLANQITVLWQSVEYPADYYLKGNNNVGYLRDEVYSFFIEWIYDTGDTSASYHIPGRPPLLFGLPGDGPKVSLLDTAPYGGTNSLNGDTMIFETFNTAQQLNNAVTPLPDGGKVIAEGYMGYWQSSEYYPDKKPQIWNSSSYCWSKLDPTNPPCPLPLPPAGPIPYSGTDIADYDLCGKPIRHHKFPEDGLSPETLLFNATTGGSHIRVMGVKFTNVKAPRTLDGQLIPGIIGYRILRGTRNGNKSIIAKGIINNLHEYAIPGSNKRGLYPNYPYNDLGDDPFLSTSKTNTNDSSGQIGGFNIMTGGWQDPSSREYDRFNRSHHTFHSPDTNFHNPFLSAREFRIYGTIHGDVTGKFEIAEEHPKEKLITNISFSIAAFAGLGIAATAASGKKKTTYTGPKFSGNSWLMIAGNGASPNPADILLNQGVGLINSGLVLADGASTLGGLDTVAALTGLTAQLRLGAQYSTATIAAGLIPNSTNTEYKVERDEGYLDNLGVLGPFFGIPLFMNYFSDGTDSIVRLIKAILRYRDFAVRYHSHGFYNNFMNRSTNTIFRNELVSQQYLNPDLLDIPGNFQVNNLFRSRTVLFNTNAAKGFFNFPAVTDSTRFDANRINYNRTPPKTIEELTTIDITSANTGPGNQVCSSFYGALKLRLRNQYGQLNNIVQLQINSCYTTFTVSPSNSYIVLSGGSTDVLFGGDTYVNRYTEKNTFFYFYDWLYGQPDGAQLDYTQHVMIPYPKYWANFNEFQTSDFTNTLFENLISFGTSTAGVTFPSDFYALDGDTSNVGSLDQLLNGAGTFTQKVKNIKFDKRGWFYLFNSGVRDFFVESEINTAFRDYGEIDAQKFYDPYQGGDTKTLFRVDIIKAGNYYKYDDALSVTKMFTNYVSWASSQPSSYDPYIAETCFVYEPTKLIYSLPAQYQGLKDGWLVFLPSNYELFNNVVTCIKPINKSGALIFFDAASPVQFQGTDQLETGLGTKLTIGDGGLFSQPMQALINVDSSHEYASCQNRLSVVNTPAGVYWISQNQGKVFTLAGGGVKEVSNQDLKWWFAQYLPYKLTEYFPDFQLIDNPVIGIGCQTMYNNKDGLIYFSKKDYVLKPGTGETIVYAPEEGANKFRLESTRLVIDLGDPLFFDNASWTASFDPKSNSWISWHDWHPTLNMPGKNTFMTIDPESRKGIWIHNERCDSYANFYGLNYPFEVEFMVNTPQEVNTLRSIEYTMEAYKYGANCYDRFHVLDFNFDEAVIYNTEQTSGLLKLILNPKQDPTAILTYPIINPTNINVLFSKEENKYRFNQFWDVTDNRGEYDPAAQRTIWNTEANGYIRILNANNIDYNKDPFQRKKFRHYTTSVLLRRLVSNDRKMLVMIANTKDLNSPR